MSDRGMVSTFSGVVLKSAVAHLFHAGDSRIYLLRDGAIEQLTRDHRVRVSREQEYLSRAVGIDTRLEIDYRTTPLEPGDILIFTTDGVHDFLRDGQMADILRAAPDDLDGAAPPDRRNRPSPTAAPTTSPARSCASTIPGSLDEEAHLEQLSALPFPPELAPGQSFEGYTILRELHL